VLPIVWRILAIPQVIHH